MKEREMRVRSRVVAGLGAATLLSSTLLVGLGPSPVAPAGAAVLTGASMPVQEFVNDGAGGRLWNSYNQTADSSGPNITGRPSALTYGISVHVESRAANGDLVEFDNDDAGHRLWNSYDLTHAAGGPTIGADPVAVLYAGTAVHIFAEAADGDLVEYTNDGAGGRLWNSYNLTAETNGPSIGGDPSPVISGTSVDVFARATTGDLVEFANSTAGNGTWTTSDITSSSGGPELNGDPAAVVAGPAIHVYAQGPGGDLYEFVSASGGPWGSSDLSQVAGGPQITGRPSPVVVGTAIDVPARATTGDLVDFVFNGQSWSSSDLTQVAGGPTIGGDPGAVLFSTSSIHIYTEGTDGNHLTEYVNDGAGGRPWSVYDLTAASGGPAVGGDPSPLVYGVTVHVYVGGPPPATPPEGVGLYGLVTGQPTDQAIEDNWPIIGDTGALGTQTVPYTGINTGADLGTGQAIVASGRRITWLSFWTVSGPVASGPGGTPCYTSDCYYADSFAAGQYVAQTIDTYASQGVHIKPDWVILDPEGYPDNHSGLDSGPGSSSANWFSFLQGWANGIVSVDPGLRAGFYADQNEINTFDLSSVQLPDFVAVAFPDPQMILTNTDNVAGYIAFGATCPASGEEATLTGAPWNGAYDTLQFTGGQYCAP
jgi:hypothetical protein